MDKIEVIRQYSPLALAYLGDGVYEVYVRNFALSQGNCQNNKLHEMGKKFTCCEGQAKILEGIWDALTEQEQEVVRRGRNAKSNSKPKNADHGTYHAATGFESLWGFLYLAGETERMNELFNKIIDLRAE